MKTKEELNRIKEEYKELNKKLAELNEDELAQVIGGGFVFGSATHMKCENPACGEDICWQGDYMTCLTYKCPYCGEMTLKGVERLGF